MTTPSILALASMTPTVLVSAKVTTATDAAVYTVPAGKAVKVAQGAITNVSGRRGSVTDAVTTNASPTVTSATAAFTASDVGKPIAGNGIPANTYVGVINSATSIGLSSSATANTPVNATVTATSVVLTFGATVTVGVSIVPSGGTIGDGTHKLVADTYSLAAGDTLPLGDYLGGHMLGDGDAIAVNASLANQLDVVISGVVMA